MTEAPKDNFAATERMRDYAEHNLRPLFSDDVLEAVRAEIGLLATDLTGIAANIAALEAKITAGSPNLDQVLADVSSLRVSADAAVATATAMATPPVPTP